MTNTDGIDPESALLHLVRQIRREAGLRQQDVADRIGQRQSFVSKYELGDRKLGVLELREVCRACSTTLAEVAGRLELLVAESRGKRNQR